jgi:hypothetical protein
LAVQTNGDMGRAGVGKANMDFFLYGDCDTVDSIPGETKIYLYDGSPVVLRHQLAPDSIIASWSIFSNGFATAFGFKPVKDTVAPVFSHAKFDTADYERITSGQFVTVDSLVAIEKTWFAPRNAGDSCNFLIQKMQVFPYKGGAVSNLAIGEAMDWDLPADSTVINTSGVDPTRNLVWQRGWDYPDETRDSLACQRNDARWCGFAMLSYYQAAKGPCDTKSDLFAGYSALNADFVLKANNFVPKELWANMQVPGLAAATAEADLHTVLTYKDTFNLAANDTLTVFTAMATVKNGIQADIEKAIDKAKAYYLGHKAISGCCCTATNTGDVDANGFVDVSDLQAYVDYLFSGIDFPSKCFLEQDVDQSGSTDISDLQTLVSFLFEGADLPLCGIKR